MLKKIRFAVLGLALSSAALVARAHEHKVPPGPIHDRHELMEGIGKNSKIIGDAMKAGKYDTVPAAAEKIEQAAGKITALFPPGSTHEHSRAKPEIWTHWPQFESDAKELQNTAGALAAAARNGKGVGEASQKMFDTCKNCHEQFRIPKKAE